MTDQRDAQQDQQGDQRRDQQAERGGGHGLRSSSGASTLLSRAAAVVAAAVLAAVAIVTLPARSEAAPPSTNPVTAAQYGARWAATKVNAEGFVPGAISAPNVSATIETALALQQAGVEQAAYERIVTWLQANVELAINPDGTNDSPGNLGELLLISTAAGIDETNFGGQNLLTRLDATLGQFAPGLYGKSDPSFDGVFRQSLALIGLATAADPGPGAVPAVAVQWLADQQCDATVPAAAGGWQPYRADLAVPCVAPNTTTFEGPDTNSSAVAVQALVATGALGGAPKAAALDFLAAAQSASGGFAFIPGGDIDPNSTALVILAILAGGEDPAGGRWSKSGGTAFSSLLSWQLGCDAAVTDRGAFASPFSGGAPDAFATRQATWGAAGKLFGMTGVATFVVAPVPCEAPTTTTTSPTTSTTTSTTPTSTTTSTVALPASDPAQPAAAVVVTPAFAG